MKSFGNESDVAYALAWSGNKTFGRISFREKKSKNLCRKALSCNYLILSNRLH
jgi:hypothetical protein